MLLVFPFEQAIYDDAGIPATYVGHPLASMIPMTPDAPAARGTSRPSVDGPVVAVLPGSRPDEVKYLGPTFLAAWSMLLRREPGIRFVLPVADASLRALLESMLIAHAAWHRPCTLVDGRSHDCLEAADTVLVASGTATLEAALFKRPMVIAYKMPAAVGLADATQGEDSRTSGLPNIMAGEFLVPGIAAGSRRRPPRLRRHCTRSCTMLRCVPGSSSALPPCTSS